MLSHLSMSSPFIAHIFSAQTQPCTGFQGHLQMFPFSSRTVVNTFLASRSRFLSCTAAICPTTLGAGSAPGSSVTAMCPQQLLHTSCSCSSQHNLVFSQPMTLLSIAQGQEAERQEGALIPTSKPIHTLPIFNNSQPGTKAPYRQCSMCPLRITFPVTSLGTSHHHLFLPTLLFPLLAAPSSTWRDFGHRICVCRRMLSIWILNRGRAKTLWWRKKLVR